jgi:hypothetical protein
LYVQLVTGEAAATVTNAEADAKEAAQSAAAADIIANRVASTSLRAVQVAAETAEPTSQKPASEEPAPGFGSVQPVAESIKPMTANIPGFVAAAAGARADTSDAASNQANNTTASKSAINNDSIDFDALATSRLAAFKSDSGVKPIETDAPDPWSEDDAHLLDQILVEADAETAKANADKAAGAAKSAAAKAAANAAFAAALAGNPDAAKTMDPKMLAAAMNLSGMGGQGGSPRVVAGRAPPAPSVATPKPASPPSLTVVKTGTSTSS